MDVFPLVPSAACSYEQAWTSKHHGTDLFADRGTAVVAVADGIARAAEDPKGGHAVYLNATDGSRYYYAHLDSWEPVLEAAGKLGMRVTAGTPLGTVGTTGNAVGKAAHLHFQVTTADGVATDPFPFLQEVDPSLAAPPAPAHRPSKALPSPAPPPSSEPSSSPRVEPLAAGAGGLVFLLVAYYFTSRKGRHR